MLAGRELPVPPFTLIVPRLPRTVKIVVYFLAIGQVGMKKTLRSCGSRTAVLMAVTPHLAQEVYLFEHDFLAIVDGVQGRGDAQSEGVQQLLPSQPRRAQADRPP